MKKGLLVSAVWVKLPDEDRTKPEVWIELEDGWHQILATKDLTLNTSLICELYPKSPISQENH